MPQPPSDVPTPLLRARRIVKVFPGVRALDGVDLEVRAGEVHCLLGQNGAGKSTLIKTLAGDHRPDEGELEFDGRTVELDSPVSALRLGIATIYQELDLVDGLSAAENIFLGHESSRFGFTRPSGAYASARELLARLGHPEIDPATPVADLAPAAKQIISMARALSYSARLIIMDEPSAALAQDETDNLFRIVRDVTSQGVAVIYISHRLEEIRAIGDRVTVLKDGATVATGLPAKTTPTSQLVSLMTGRNVEHVFPAKPSRHAFENRETVLSVSNLTSKGIFSDVSLTVRAGEIVGIAGLVGSGRSEILEAIYGARPSTGTVLFEGKSFRGGPDEAVRLGLGFAPEERKAQGLLLDQSVGDNITVSSLGKLSRFGWVNRAAAARESDRLIKELEIRPANQRRVIRTLSGGNQQKAVIARWLIETRKLLLLDEPTRGVDIGARAEIYAVIRALAESGVSVLLVSSEVPEVLGLADRVLVIREGHVIRTAPAEELDEHAVLDLIMEGSRAA